MMMVVCVKESDKKKEENGYGEDKVAELAIKRDRKKSELLLWLCACSGVFSLSLTFLAFWDLQQRELQKKKKKKKKREDNKGYGYGMVHCMVCYMVWWFEWNYDDHENETIMTWLR